MAGHLTSLWRQPNHSFHRNRSNRQRRAGHGRPIICFPKKRQNSPAQLATATDVCGNCGASQVQAGPASSPSSIAAKLHPSFLKKKEKKLHPSSSSPMAVAFAAGRRLITPARRGRAFWSASWSADSTPAYSGPSSPSTDKKKKGPTGQHRLAAVIDAVNERKLPPELRGRGNAVRYRLPSLIQWSLLLTRSSPQYQ